jgi:probable HAF family extracellular repeat protein
LWNDGEFTLIDVPNSVVTIAWRINNAGQIVGFYLDAAGTTHGFVATPDLAWNSHPRAAR